MAAVVPLIAAGVSAFGQHQQGQAAKKQAQEQSLIDQMEGKSAEEAALQDEATQRRSSRQFLGRQAAAFAEAGVGPGSSTAIMDQSAINAELDALNIRYKGQLTKYGYSYNSKSSLKEGRSAANNANLMAGATLLKGVSNYYAGANG